MNVSSFSENRVFQFKAIYSFPKFCAFVFVALPPFFTDSEIVTITTNSENVYFECWQISQEKKIVNFL